MDDINKKTLGIDHNGRAIMIRSQVLLLMLCISLICMKHIALKLMINLLTIMTMMMILILIQIMILEMILMMILIRIL